MVGNSIVSGIGIITGISRCLADSVIFFSDFPFHPSTHSEEYYGTVMDTRENFMMTV